jgi:hypothetical protein
MTGGCFVGREHFPAWPGVRGSSASLVVTTLPAVPVPEPRRKDLLRSMCQNISRMFHEPHKGPNLLTENGLMACDGWLADASKKASYMMLICLTPDGAVLLATGTDRKGLRNRTRSDAAAVPRLDVAIVR